MSLIEPYEENVDKMFKIEKKRVEKGESWSEELVFPIHNIITSGNSFMIVETNDLTKLVKYRQDYYGVFDIEIYPIEEFSKLRDLYK
jgi:hypothetical protein